MANRRSQTGKITDKDVINRFFDALPEYMTFSEEEKQAITDLDVFSFVKKGTVLLREGQRSDKSYFVFKGCLRAYYIINGEEKTTSFYTDMDGFSPPCAVIGTPSALYIDCVEDSIIAAMSAEMINAMLAKYPKNENYCRIFSEQLLAKEQAQFDEYKTSTPEQRYLNLRKTRPDLLQRVPQHQLASYLGITPQSLSRLRARIAKKKIS